MRIGNSVVIATTVGGMHTADATGGDITQTGALAITGTSSFTARNGTGGEVFLTDDTNTFGDGVTLVSRTGDNSMFGDGDHAENCRNQQRDRRNLKRRHCTR